MRTEMEKGKQLAGVMAIFDNPAALLEATKKVRDQKYEIFDVFTPYPVHGLDEAQGLKRSPIPFITFIAALTGCSIGFILQYWTSAVNWPLNVGGKPFNSWPAFVPVMFELTILFAGLSTVASMIILNGLPNISRKVYDSTVTRDRFAIVVETPKHFGRTAEDLEENDIVVPKHFKPFQESEVTQFLTSLGAKEVRSVYAEGWF